MIDTLVLLAVGAAFGIGGGWCMAAYWGLWRRGVETRATVVRVANAQLGMIRSRDQSGVEHIVDGATPPRFGSFTLNQTRPLVFLPENPRRWEWWDRRYQRFMVLLGAWLCLIGLCLAAEGVYLIFKPEPRKPPPSRLHAPPLQPQPTR